MREPELLGLVGNVHDAVLAADGWGDFARALEETISGCNVSLVVPLEPDVSVLEAVERDRRGILDVIEWHAPSASPEFHEPFLERFRFESWNPFLVPRVVSPGAGRVWRTDELLSLRELSRSAMFNEWMKPQDLAVGPNLVGYLQEGVQDIPALHLFRRRGRRPFSESDRRALRVLIPHMQQAVRVKAHLASAKEARAPLLEVLDRLTVGVILVDAKGCVVEANRAARETLGARDGLELHRGELRAATPAKTHELHRFLRDAMTTAAGQGVGSGGALTLPRSGKRHLVALIAPLRSWPVAAGMAATAIFLTDSEIDCASFTEVLRAIYGLTPREAQLALELARGRTVEEAAAHLGTTIGTERSRIRDLFAKTGTDRQAALVQVLLREAAQVRGAASRAGRHT